ncbi:MAG: phosphoribosyltransferase [Bacteroidetes bacterium]|nr:phosphoribosyltransferase [Bacteroidota bacterium]
MSTEKKVQLLNDDEIRQKTRRMAYQIVESNFDAKELILIGIHHNGLEYARQLKTEIEGIGSSTVLLMPLSLDKKHPLQHDIKLDNANKSLDNKTVIVVDDVANTGKTLYYALKPVMEYAPKKVQVVVLLDRQHKLFPITPDFVGLSLSTTMQEHIEVEFDEKGKARAFLV